MFFTAEIQPSVIAMFWKRIPKLPQAVLAAELNEGSKALFGGRRHRLLNAADSLVPAGTAASI